MNRQAGIIIWFGGYEDYGFISRPNTSDIFIHESNVLCDSSLLNEGTVVSFAVEVNPRNGKEHATALKLLIDEEDVTLLRQCFISSDRRYSEAAITPYLAKLSPQLAIAAVEERVQSLLQNVDALDRFLGMLPTSVRSSLNVDQFRKQTAATAFYHQQKTARSVPSETTSCFSDIAVVGVTYNNRQTVIAGLNSGDPIILRREPNNPYDSNAIRVETQYGTQVGYIDRLLAARLAPLLDQVGKPILGKVTGIYGGRLSGSNLGLRISFSIPTTVSSAAAIAHLPIAEDLDL